jgi:hypothetical protein
MMSCGMARMAQYVTTGLPGTTASHSKHAHRPYYSTPQRADPKPGDSAEAYYLH